MQGSKKTGAAGRRLRLAPTALSWLAALALCGLVPAQSPAQDAGSNVKHLKVREFDIPLQIDPATAWNATGAGGISFLIQ